MNTNEPQEGSQHTSSQDKLLCVGDAHLDVYGLTSNLFGVHWRVFML